MGHDLDDEELKYTRKILKEDESVIDIIKHERVRRPEKMKKFIEELIQVMNKYNLTLSHEDCHGAFIVENYDYHNIIWLRDSLKGYEEIEEENENHIPHID